jgi:hypothetical protein
MCQTDLCLFPAQTRVTMLSRKTIIKLDWSGSWVLQPSNLVTSGYATNQELLDGRDINAQSVGGSSR